MEQGFYALMKFKTIYGRCIGSNSRLNDFSNAFKIVFQFDMKNLDLNEPISPFFTTKYKHYFGCSIYDALAFSPKKCLIFISVLH